MPLQLAYAHRSLLDLAVRLFPGARLATSQKAASHFLVSLATHYLGCLLVTDPEREASGQTGLCCDYPGEQGRKAVSSSHWPCMSLFLAHGSLHA